MDNGLIFNYIAPIRRTGRKLVFAALTNVCGVCSDLRMMLDVYDRLNPNRHRKDGPQLVNFKKKIILCIRSKIDQKRFKTAQHVKANYQTNYWKVSAGLFPCPA